MRLPTIAALMTLSLTAHVLPVLATDQAPLITERQQRQEARIRAGVESGQLTRDEAAVLIARQKSIKARRRAMAADGRLNKSERTVLRYEQQAAQRALRQERHDAEYAN